MNTPKPAPQTQVPGMPQPPAGWDKNPICIQLENGEKRLTLQFPNIGAMADWLDKVKP